MMPTRFSQYTFCLLALGLLLSPGLVYAHEGPGIPPHSHDTNDPKKPFGKFDTGFGPLEGSIDEAAQPKQGKRGPLVEFLDRFILIVRGVVVSIGLIAVVIGGYRYMTAGGDSSKVAQAKVIIGMAIFGIILAVAGQLFLNLIGPQFFEEVQEPTIQLQNQSPTK